MPNPISVQKLGGSIGRPRLPDGSGPAPRGPGTMGPGSRFDAQGMIAASNFTDNDGDLMSVSFRFLNSIFDCIRYLEADMTALETASTAATLPPAAVSRGARRFVSDAAGPVFGAVVAGGGTAYVPVYCDGVNWRVG